MLKSHFLIFKSRLRRLFKTSKTLQTEICKKYFLSCISLEISKIHNLIFVLILFENE